MDATQNERIRSTEPFGIKDKLGYMFGDVANNMTFFMASSFLMIFYTEVLYIEGAMVGTLFVVARIVDAFTDIGMGKIVDKVPATKEGKFRPWFRRIAGPVALASFLMYQPAMVNAPMGWRIVYMYVTYLLWGSVFYTAINIPYGSLASAVSPDPEHRTSLSVFRGAGGAIAGMLAGTIVPLFIYTTDAQGNEVVSGTSFVIAAGVMAILAIIFYVILYKWTTERVAIQQADDEEEVSFVQSMKQVFTSRSLVSIMAASVGFLMVMLMIQQMVNYILPFYYGNSGAVALNNLLMTGSGLLILPLASKLGRSIGKKEAGSAGMLVGALAYFTLYFIRPESEYVYILFNTIAFLGINIFNGVVWANITDVIDDHEIQTGQRADGTIYGVNSFSRKIGQSLAGGSAGFALTLIGYESGAATQAPAVLERLFNVSVLIPAFGLLITALILFFWYPLSKDKVEENQQYLAEKAANENE